MLNFNQLQTFCEAARCQNFSQAARNRCVTQPAVTGQIRALEEAIELKLFKKRGRRMVLSETGALLFQQAREVFELEKRMERLIDEVRELKRGLLKIGTTKTYARYLMPGLISRFRAAHPEIKVILEEGSSPDVCRSLLDLRNELAVVALTEEMGSLTFLPFREEEVVLFAAPSHPLTRRRKGIAFAELEGELVILKEEGPSTYALVRGLFERRGPLYQRAGADEQPGVHQGDAREGGGGELPGVLRGGQGVGRGQAPGGPGAGPGDDPPRLHRLSWRGRPFPRSSGLSFDPRGGEGRVRLPNEALRLTSLGRRVLGGRRTKAYGRVSQMSRLGESAPGLSLDLLRGPV